MLSVNTDEEARTHTYRLLVASHKVVVIGRFKIPAEAMSAGRPEHEVARNLTRNRVRRRSILTEIDPLRPYAEHELGLPRQRPGFLKEQVCVPFRRVARKEGRYTRLKLQPVFNRRGLRCQIRREARSTSGGVPACCCPKLHNYAGVVAERWFILTMRPHAQNRSNGNQKKRAGSHAITLKPIVAIGSNMSATFRIGELAKRTGVKVVTIRYYEQAGLLPECERSTSNYRVYAPEHLERLRFVRRCRDLGFSLEQIRDMLLLSNAESSTCADVCNVAADHLRDVESKIADLKLLASELRRIRSSCDGKRSSRECRIIAALARS